MKTLIKPFVYIISALMVLSFASCNDFLDKEPEGKVPEEKVDYTNLSNMLRFVLVVFTGLYGKSLPFATKTYSVVNGMVATTTT